MSPRKQHFDDSFDDESDDEDQAPALRLSAEMS